MEPLRSEANVLILKTGVIMRGSKLALEVAGVFATAGVFMTGMIRQFSDEGSPLTLAIIFSSAINFTKGLNNILSSEQDQIQPHEIQVVNVLPNVDIDLEQGNGTHFRDMVTASRVSTAVSR